MDTNGFYINLKKRTDRRAACEKLLYKIGFENIERFEAVETKNGLIGCALSHIKCIQMAKDRGYDKVLIFEDDIVCDDTMECRYLCTKFINVLEYDVLMLGCWYRDETWYTEEEHTLKIKKALTTHAYVIKNDYYDMMIDNMKEGIKQLLLTRQPRYHIDEHLGVLQKKHNWISFKKILFSQEDGFSDNFGEFRPYKQSIYHIPGL